jgi:glycosyltransferase involved in cell wall biosynthesis
MLNKSGVKNKPTVSVVMAVYNGAKYLRESIESILYQSYQDFEFIIIDDGSSDETSTILAEYRKTDFRFSIFRNASNQWLAASLNRGLREAQGEYIARQDADDIALPNRFELQLEYLEKHRNIFLVGSNLFLIDETGRVCGRRRFPSSSNELGNTLPKHNAIAHPTIMFRNDGTHFYREKFRFSQDYDFYLRLLTEGRQMANIPEYLIRYRQSNQNTSAKNDLRLKQFLFSNKIQEFYLQRKSTGKDHYDDFSPDKIFEIKAADTTDPLVLDWLIRRSFRQKKCRSTKLLVRRQFQSNGFSKSLIKPYIGSWLGKKGLTLLQKTNHFFYRDRQPFFPESTMPCVGLLSTHGYGLQTWQVAGTLNRELAIYQRLFEKAFPVTLFTFDEKRNVPQIAFSANIVTAWPYLFSEKLLLFYQLFYPFLRYSQGRKTQVLITNQAHSGWSAILAGWIWRTKVIARCGFVRGEQVETLGITSWAAQLKVLMEKWTFKYADRCFIPTKELADWVINNYGIPPSKIDIVPNFVDTEQFYPDTKHPQDIDVLCIGRLSDTKQHHLALHALKGTNAKITIIGAGVLESSLRQIATTNDVDLTIVNRVQNEELRGYLNRAKIYLIASKWEGHPKALIEAMACGCACIGVRSKGIENQIKHGQTGFLVNAEVESIAQHIKMLLNNKTLRNELGAAAHHYAIAHFSLEAIFQQYKKIILGITTNSPLPNVQRAGQQQFIYRPIKQPAIGLFFTHGYGLSNWQELGSLNRELSVYQKLSNQGCSVILYTFDRTRKIPSLDFSAKIISSWPYLFHMRFLPLYICLMPFLYYWQGRKVDILITNQAHSGWGAIIASWVWRNKVIARCGFLRGEEIEILGLSGYKVFWKKFMEKWTFTHADRCFIPTKEMADWAVSNYGLDKNKIEIVPNFVNTNLFSPSKNTRRDIDILCLGRLTDIKRYALILDSLKDLEVKITIIGSGPLETYIQDMAIANDIDLTIIKKVQNEKLPYYFNKAKVYLIASIKEGHPKSLIEAMACGCACVGTYSPGIMNQISDGKTGLLADSTPESISKCVSVLLADKALRKELGDNARQYALDNFSLDQIYEQYHKIFTELLGEPMDPLKKISRMFQQ